ncbi:hypothetical protein C6A77_13860 [Pseudomonas sp. AFG_SD02_1510_Pfu_092]|uniref:hypothetical protein n=1 Tax=Pseudomonas sp. AFG_SD02_1510_Pfu_092 TaxID=2259497 RepID=UPI000DEFCA96|nr:hypothetical protein [Pseudomonas sp. AFG_SD02_1510_Pfu_092]RCL25572.1 hypothetical protein C6A77_13860 [Pseudomonas sp. AFG_SD02_1510_Pfu_092]
MKLSEGVGRLQALLGNADQRQIAEVLQALAENRNLLGDGVQAHLREHGFTRGDQAYNAHSFSLFHSAQMSLRMTLWMPAEAAVEQQAFIYGLPHSHDFELYAVGYHGNGYRSVKHAIGNAAQLREGVKAAVGAAQSLRLSPGTVLHMRAYEDMHYVAPPDEFSVSLALMIADARGGQPGQRAWSFDQDLQPIHSGIDAHEADTYKRIEALWQAHRR